jgi:ssDNA-binding Zn-finger/Zn-ribbon topoisomerase 1
MEGSDVERGPIREWFYACVQTEDCMELIKDQSAGEQRKEVDCPRCGAQMVPRFVMRPR